MEILCLSSLSLYFVLSLFILIFLIAKINVRELISRSTLIVKKELLYLFPFGQLSWLMGVEFVDRSNPVRASKTLSQCERLMVDKNIKIWVYPEGTRSYGKGIQQFKRGAFKIAIQAQAPVVPIVISPYHFLDYKQKHIGRGKFLFLSYINQTLKVCMYFKHNLS